MYLSVVIDRPIYLFDNFLFTSHFYPSNRLISRPSSVFRTIQETRRVTSVKIKIMTNFLIYHHFPILFLSRYGRLMLMNHPDLIYTHTFLTSHLLFLFPEFCVFVSDVSVSVLSLFYSWRH